MKLERVYIESYKELKKFEIIFTTNDLYRSYQKCFFIGKNGSGKSSFIEALTLICSRIIQNEVPGFYFELKYTLINGDDEVNMFVRPFKKNDNRKSKLYVSCNGSDLNLENRSFSEYNEFHPNKIISFASGPNNVVDKIIYESALEALKSDIYDVNRDSINENDDSGANATVTSLKADIETLITDPRCLFLDNTSSKFALLIMLAFLPGALDGYEEEKYKTIRKKILAYASNLDHPVSISFTTKQPLSLSDDFKLRYYNFYKILNKTNGENAWSNRVISEDEESQTCHTFVFNNYKDYIDTFSDLKPLSLLSELITLQREGILTDSSITFKTKEDLISEQELSDGEILWLGRLALLLIFATYGNNNTMFIFDEPDIFLNESWIASFVSEVNEIISDSLYGKSFSILMSTHSSLLLSDADLNEVFQFEKKERITALNPHISLFGSDIQEIYKHMFMDKNAKTFSRRIIDETLSNGNKENIKKLIQRVGPGYNYFRLLDKLYSEE